MDQESLLKCALQDSYKLQSAETRNKIVCAFCSKPFKKQFRTLLARIDLTDLDSMVFLTWGASSRSKCENDWTITVLPKIV